LRISTLFAILILFLSIISINPWSSLPIGNNTIITYFLYLATIIVAVKIITKDRFELPFVIKIYLIWAIIGIFRGVFIAENYYEWKQLFEKSCALLLPLFIPLFMNPFILQRTLTYWVKYALKLFIVLGFFINLASYGFYLPPLVIFGIFYPTLNRKWKIITISLIVLVIFADPYEARSSVIKFSIVILIILSYYFKPLLTKPILRGLGKVIVIMPIIFLFLGLTGEFNVFNFKSYVAIENKDADLSDTRSFIYEEQIASALNNNYVIWGRTPARGFDSIFGERINEEIKKAGNTNGAILKNERQSCEVLFLNVFNYLGLIGVILYSLIYLVGGFLVLYKSNNLYIKMIGLYTLFRFTYGWVEDFNRFDIQSISLMMMIAMCYSNQFRQMTNKDITYWVRGIFDKRYRNYDLSLFK
jgi:hypothetical protein